jgi:hypothetical protein
MDEFKRRLYYLVKKMGPVQLDVKPKRKLGSVVEEEACHSLPEPVCPQGTGSMSPHTASCPSPKPVSVM